MVLEVAALVVAIVNAIIAGQPVFSKLWEKIKNFFGGSSKIPYSKALMLFLLKPPVSPERRLKASPQHLIEAHLRPLLQRDAQLYRDTEAYYRQRGVTQSSQWETWGPEDDAEWA